MGLSTLGGPVASELPPRAPFVVTADYKPAQGATSSDLLRKHMADAPQQMNLWPELQAA